MKLSPVGALLTLGLLLGLWVTPFGEARAQGPLPVETRVTSDDPQQEDLFATSVSIFGDLLMVGAPYDDDRGDSAGAVYVFGRTDGWRLLQRLYASDASANARFGGSLDNYANTLVVGAGGAEAAYVFSWNGQTWSEVAKLTPWDGVRGQFGSVAIGRNMGSDTIVVGSPVARAAYVFVRNGSAWVPQQKLLPPSAAGGVFGSAVAIYGDTIVVGEHDAEAAHVFTRNNGVWAYTRTLRAPDPPAEPERFGYSVGVHNGVIVVGTSQSRESLASYTPGRAFVFQGNGTGSVQELTASDGTVADMFGQAVSIFGDRIVVGAPRADAQAEDTGAVYVFDWDGSQFVEVQKSVPSDAESIGLSGLTVDNGAALVAAGAPYMTVGQVPRAGAAYVFEEEDPLGWRGVDIGNVAARGQFTLNNGVLEIYGSGADIWERADEFFFVYQVVNGDFEIVGRVTSLQNTHPWAKLGLMAREAFGPGERNVMVFLTPQNGAGLQWRPTIGGLTQYTPAGPAQLPTWLRLVRSGSTFTGYKSSNGNDWTLIGSVTLESSTTMYVGMALTSHQDGVLARAVLDNVSVGRAGADIPAAPTGLTATAISMNEIRLNWTDSSTNETGFEIQRSTDGSNFGPLATVSGTTHNDTQLDPGTRYWYRVRAVNQAGASAWSNVDDAMTSGAGGGLPSPWQTQDVGGASGGSATFENGVFTVRGSGADIWDSNDQFRYVYQSANGDVTIITRVNSLTASHPWAKAGLMLRETLSGNARNALVFVTPTQGVGFQWRATAGGSSQYIAGPWTVRAPVWLKLVRSGNTVSGYWSTDGQSWQLVGSTNIGLPSAALAGLAVTSHQNGVVSTANYSNVSVTGGGEDLPPPWQHQDVGAVGIPGDANYSEGTFTLSGSGADIWNNADAFHYVYQPWNGDGQITAEVTQIQNTHPWAKVGVMFRQTLTANSGNAYMMFTAVHGSGFQSRAATGASSTYVPGPSFIRWVRLVRQGNVFTGWTSTDKTNWTFVGSQTIPMSGTAYVGMAVTSHNNGQLNTSAVRDVQVSVR